MTAISEDSRIFRPRARSDEGQGKRLEEDLRKDEHEEEQYLEVQRKRLEEKQRKDEHEDDQQLEVQRKRLEKEQCEVHRNRRGKKQQTE